MPVKSTIKEVDGDAFVVRAPPRASLWEVQTPQVIRPAILREGFARVEAENLEVTDDVSIVEQLGLPVRITSRDYQNIKLTTPEGKCPLRRARADAHGRNGMHSQTHR